MKKVIALLLACVLAFAMVACGGGEKADVKGEGVMTYAEYAAAALDTEVTIEALQAANIINKTGDGVKVIATGELTKKLNVKVNAFSEGAKAKIEALGGTCEVI